MTRAIVYDLVRLMFAPFSETPRGIDRIDFGIAEALHNDWPTEVSGIAPMPWGMRWFGRDKLEQGIDALNAMWREKSQRETDPAYARLKQFLADPEHPLARGRRPSALMSNIRAIGRFFYFMTSGKSWQMGRRPSALPQNAIYLNIGHYGLSAPRLLRWLDTRPDIKSVFMVHDVIPLETPELVSPRNNKLHKKLMDVVIRHANALIVPSEASKQATLVELRRRGAPEIPIYPITLPIGDAFTTPLTPDPDLATRPYFLIVGAVESRKNHMLLFHIWRKMAERMGKDTPALIVAGPPGWFYDYIHYYMANCEALRGHVYHASGLSTPALRSVMMGARALLMPSFVEGFGLPPVEALATGTPAVLSDIPAHREAAGDFGIFLDPTDGPGWARQIESMIHDTPDYLAHKARVATFRPKTWPQYMREVEDLLLTME